MKWMELLYSSATWATMGSTLGKRETKTNKQSKTGNSSPYRLHQVLTSLPNLPAWIYFLELSVIVIIAFVSFLVFVVVISGADKA